MVKLTKLTELTRLTKLTELSKSNYSTTIAIDAERSVFHFYSMFGNDRSAIAHNIKSYSGSLMDDDFFAKFKDAVKEFAENTPSETVRKVTVVLPNRAVVTDAVKMPTMRGGMQTKKMLDITLGGLFRNYGEMRTISHNMAQNRQYSTFAVAAVQKRIASAIYAACSENKLLVDTLTYSSSAVINGAFQLDPKLKNASYLFLDLKDVYATFIFVVKGKVVGHYTLPFGLEFLKKPKVTQEDMLFDHTYAELTVLNARERAKSKKLTVMALGETQEEADVTDADEMPEETIVPAVSDEDSAVEQEAEEETAAEEIPSAEETVAMRVQQNQKFFTRKAPRKLPKFMLREIPETRDAILYENFRVFVKWALTLIASNDKLTELGKPEFVCVNLPKELGAVIEKTNEEAEENGITFVALSRDDVDDDICSNLELYGGLFPKHICPTGKF